MFDKVMTVEGWSGTDGVGHNVYVTYAGVDRIF
jgi:hypothetical protein